MAEMYSKKVMEYFHHPKNMGEIKNADGIGKVGNPTCLFPSTKIQTNDNLKLIYKMGGSEKVLSHTGKYNTIKRKIKRMYGGDLIRIKNRLGTLNITPEHEVLAIKIPKTHHFLYIENKQKKIKAWYPAEELEKGDIMLFPLPKETKNQDNIKIKLQKAKYDFKSRELPKTVKIGPDFLRLAGYYLSEGHIKDKKCNTYISFAFHIKEEEYVNDVREIIWRLFQIPVKITPDEKRKTTRVFVYNAHLARFFKQLFGVGAEIKKIPEFIMLLPPKRQRALIKGLWRGDGFVNLKKPRAGFVTISHALCHQLKLLLMRQGIIPSVYSEREKIINDTYHRTAYRIHVGNRNSVLKLLEIMGLDYTGHKKTQTDSWVDKDFIYIPITQIQKIRYNGLVFNLEVTDAMSYVTESATVHNCGDLMWIYIKVGKNKKGQEIIKDIKVKTFGCVAAIASSSVTTALVKGKTIEEAEKLTKADVAKALQGLPPVKMHCSVLSIDALKEAIKDYRAKKKK